MNEKLSRRKALKGIGSAGVVALLDAQSLTAQEAAIRIAGRLVEITVAPVSAVTARLSVTPVVDGRPQTLPHDGSLAQRTWSPPVARITSLTRARHVRCGDLVVKITPDPLTIRVEAKDGRLVQQLRPDQQTGADNGRIRATHRKSGDAAALVTRLFAIAPNIGRPRRDQMGRADFPRK